MVQANTDSKRPPKAGADADVTAVGAPARNGRRWPLLVILAVQAALSARLMAVSGPSNDEALYLRIGHLEIAHWLHGSPAPPVTAFLSGSPVVYPPLGALASSAAGLTGARVLSLAFMLGATALLWATASRLYSRAAAAWSAALFAVLASVIHVGSLATYDAMALFLVVLAAWCALRLRARWLVIATVALVLANAAKYASALFDPVVVAAAVLAPWSTAGRRPAILRGLLLAGGVLALLGAVILLAGSPYWHGVLTTTLARRQGPEPAGVVLGHALAWIWAVLIAALGGVAISSLSHQPRSRTALLAVFAAAGFLAPAEQARIHTLVSLDKHVAFGAWFAAIPAGYAVSYVTGALRARHTRGSATQGSATTQGTGQGGRVVVGAGLVVIVLLAILGVAQSQAMVGPDTTARLIPVLRRLTARQGHFLSDDARVEQYYLPRTMWSDWTAMRSHEAPTTTARLISQLRGRYFTLVILGIARKGSPEARLRGMLDHGSDYRLVATVPYSVPGHQKFLIWQLRMRAGRQ